MGDVCSQPCQKAMHKNEPPPVPNTSQYIGRVREKQSKRKQAIPKDQQMMHTSQKQSRTAKQRKTCRFHMNPFSRFRFVLLGVNVGYDLPMCPT